MEYLPDRCGGFTGNHLTDGAWIRLLDYGTIRGNHLLDDVRGVEVAAVHCSRYRCRELNGSNGNALPETDTSKVVFRDVFFIRHDAGGFTVKDIAGLLTETECIEIIVKFADAHAQRKLHEAAVAGIFGSLCKILTSVACMLPAFNSLAVHNIAAVAEESGIEIGVSGVDSRCQSQYLEGGARLVDVRNEPVA